VGLLYVNFNQDGSCVALGTQEGIKIFNVETHKICYNFPVGAVSTVEMLFCTSLVGFVGAGEQPALTPRKLSVLNTFTNRTIQDLTFTTSVLAVLMNRQRLVVVLEHKAYVYALQNLVVLRTLDMAFGNPKGVAALCPCAEPSLLALPASSETGTLRVYDVLFDGGNVLCEVEAHKTALSLMAWNHDGTLLASASSKGTVIRVHRLPQAVKAYTFRRGTYPATIHSLAFSPPGVEPPLLCATSSHGSVHVFRLEEAAPIRGVGPAAAASAAAGLLSAVMKYSVADMVEPPRNILSMKLPNQAVPATAAILPAAAAASGPPAQQQQQQAQEGRAPSRSTPDAGSVVVAVATLEGVLYEYCITELGGAHTPRVNLQGEWLLQPPADSTEGS